MRNNEMKNTAYFKQSSNEEERIPGGEELKYYILLQCEKTQHEIYIIVR